VLAVLLLALIAPVDGPIARAFDYGPDPFARGQHRGVDLAASPGTPVRAACGGRVVAAGRVAGRGVVSVSCGGRRVSHLPVASIQVAPGETVRRGARVGTVAVGHDGLHLGVRIEGDPFGYVDPEPLLLRPATPPALPVLKAPRGGERIRARPRWPRVPAPASARPAPAPETAPWPAYAGLGLLAAGAMTGGAARRRRRRRAEVGTSAAWSRASA
jgi:hypothetical protein